MKDDEVGREGGSDGGLIQSLDSDSFLLFIRDLTDRPFGFFRFRKNWRGFV